jgi:tetratricopeptide (TPR) repeat protein
MNNYEFWDELGKIFNAVAAYQEKSVEFNKRFINPWIRLGNVFDRQDRNKEAIAAYGKAIELDPGNAQNWYELGNIHFRMGSYDEAVEAYNKAIELASESGWSYNNLALTFVTQGRFTEAVPLYQKSIELLREDKDKAVAWNRLGNVYRKLNEYELAIQAFQKADELDKENAGFRDDLDEVSEGPSLVEGSGNEDTDPNVDDALSPIHLILAQGRAEEAAFANGMAEAGRDAEAPAGSESAQPQVSTPVLPSEAVSEQTSGTLPKATVDTPLAPAASQADGQPAEQIEQSAAEMAEDIPGGPAEQPSDRPAEPASANEQTITVVVQNTVETYTDALAVADPVTDTSDIALLPDQAAEEPGPDEAVAAISGQDLEAEAVAADLKDALPEETLAEPEAADEPVQAEVEEVIFHEVVTAEENLEEGDGQADSDIARSDHVAYEEYLKDNNEPINIFAAGSAEETAEGQNAATPPEPAAQIDPSGELTIEVDTKNAHVWNELGNVYFNTGAFDDAVVAYSKAIELDRWFAWPYSNLALTYVQKGRFVEAILLYQRSIELFQSEKDKAISWNRLGNVYRRLNDYDNAIAAYQRADEMDPANATLSLQSRFSLLGNFHTDQKPTYVS